MNQQTLISTPIPRKAALFLIGIAVLSLPHHKARAEESLSPFTPLQAITAALTLQQDLETRYLSVKSEVSSNTSRSKDGHSQTSINISTGVASNNSPSPDVIINGKPISTEPNLENKAANEQPADTKVRIRYRQSDDNNDTNYSIRINGEDVLE